MLMHHFGAEKHGVQGLVDQKDPKNAKVNEKCYFQKEKFFSGVAALLTTLNEGQTQCNANPSRHNFCF